MSAPLDMLVEAAAKKMVRISMLTLICIVVAAVWAALRVKDLETHLTHLDDATQHCWQIGHQVDYMNAYKIANPLASVPDPIQTVVHLRVMNNEHGGERLLQKETQ